MCTSFLNIKMCFYNHSCVNSNPMLRISRTLFMMSCLSSSSMRSSRSVFFQSPASSGSIRLRSIALIFVSVSPT